MDIIGCLNRINAVGKYMVVGRYLVILVLALNLLPLTAATLSTEGSRLCSGLESFCNDAQVFLGGAIMIMILLAGGIYAIGQVLGAETRARASVWATAMLTGAIIGALIYVITPPLIKAILPEGAGGVQVDTNNPCDFGCS